MECSICLSKINDIELIKTPCLHNFHCICLYNWEIKNNNINSCPNCRTILLSVTETISDILVNQIFNIFNCAINLKDNFTIVNYLIVSKKIKNSFYLVKKYTTLITKINLKESEFSKFQGILFIIFFYLKFILVFNLYKDYIFQFISIIYLSINLINFFLYSTRPHLIDLFQNFIYLWVVFVWNNIFYNIFYFNFTPNINLEKHRLLVNILEFLYFLYTFLDLCFNIFTNKLLKKLSNKIYNKIFI